MFLSDKHQPLDKSQKMSSNLRRKTMKCIKDYLKGSTLHGLRYIGDNTFAYTERIFWLISFGAALASAIYFINAVYYNYNNAPVIMVINPTPLRMDNVPFPALTLCSMNKIRREQAEMILQNGTESDKSFVQDLCDFNSSSSFLMTTKNETENVDIFYNFVKRVSQPCHEMLKKCIFRKTVIDCGRIFRSSMTDDGLCCSFNRLPVDYIFRSQDFVRRFNQYYESYEIDNWNPEKGYSENIPPENVFPFRSLGAGASQGLIIELDVDSENYYCSSTASVGFKLRFHTPSEIPRVQSFSFFLLPHQEYHISFKPVIEDSTRSLRNMDVDKRKCYFVEEKYLKYYRIYNRVNCRIECLINYTAKTCGCVPNYIPSSSSEKVCGGLQENCRNVVEATLDEQENKEEENNNKCNCLPECFHLDYDTTLSFATNFDDKVKGNSTIVKIFPETMYCDRVTRTELYGFVEFLSFTGGLLALFLGLGFLSIVEIFYHLSLKILCRVLRRNRNKRRISQCIQK